MANSVMMFDALGFPPDDPERAHRAHVDREAAGRQSRTRPIASPACRRSGTPRSPRHALLEIGERRQHRQRATRARLAEAAAGARRERRLGVQAAGRAARRLGLPIRQSALSRSRRHRGGRHGHGRARSKARRRASIDAAIDARRANGSRACRAATAAGAPSTPTTRTTTSTTSRSPTTARCSIRRPPT